MTDLFPPPHANLNGHGTLAGKPAMPGRRRPPTTVRIAVWCLYAITALMVLNIVGSAWDLATWGTYVDRVASSVHATAAQVATEKSDNTSGDIVGIVLFALMAMLYATSAVLVRRGSRPGQVLAFVGVPLLLLCGIGSFVSASTTPLENAAQNQQPSLMAVTGAIAVLPLVPLIIAVAVLLLTGSARTFFRRLPPAPPGYMYVPAANWSPTAFPDQTPQWVYPVYGGVPQAQPFAYPPADAHPPSGFPSLPPPNPAPPQAPPSEPQDDQE